MLLNRNIGKKIAIRDFPQIVLYCSVLHTVDIIWVMAALVLLVPLMKDSRMANCTSTDELQSATVPQQGGATGEGFLIKWRGGCNNNRI